MSTSAQFLNPSEAAQRLGVSVKALRLYERRGLIKPIRTAAGWRMYGPKEMTTAGEIVALRALGLSLAHVAGVLRGDPADLEPALAAHQAALEIRIRQLADTVQTVSALRTGVARGAVPTGAEIARLAQPERAARAVIDLPWPWGGERFEFGPVRALNYIVGPLGSGKTRLARAIAENLPGTVFVGLDRLAHSCATAEGRMAADPELASRVDHSLAWLTEDGAEVTPALVTLLVALSAEGAAALVVDMVEQGLDHATQEALIAYLRRRGPEAPSLFLLTRSNAILDLAAVGHDEAIMLCPANHSPPTYVAPYPGVPGYEAVATCLASPEVRARTEGLVAMRPQVA